jgi:NAD(P)-dependent dehydrogenase (short-subunit alcohol dehydrogenase family)
MNAVLITGSTDGIGRETARQLAGGNWRVILHGRSESRCRNTLEEIRESTGNREVEFLCADLSSQKEIKRMAQEVSERFSSLNVLINNAGVFEHERILTADGVEKTFAVNHLAGFLLTGLLLNRLKENSPARIINVSSMTHSSEMDFSNLQGEKHYSGYEAYALSKLANILFSFRLADRLKNDGITVNCLHPGVINTKLLDAGWGMCGTSVEKGAETSVYLASSPEVEGVSGRYFRDSRPCAPAEIAGNRKIQDRLWNLSESLCGYSYDF